MKGTLAMFNLAVSVVPPFSNVARRVYLQTGNTMKNLLALRQKKQEKLEQMNALLSSAENENRSFVFGICHGPRLIRSALPAAEDGGRV